MKSYILKLKPSSIDFFKHLLVEQKHECDFKECFVKLNDVMSCDLNLTVDHNNNLFYGNNHQVEYSCQCVLECQKLQNFKLVKMANNYFIVARSKECTCLETKIGLDLNQDTLITDSNNNKYDLIKTRKYINTLNDLQQDTRLDKEKKTQKITKIKNKIVNNLSQEINQIVNDLLFNNDVIIIEDLGLTKKIKFNYKINNYVYSFFRSVLISKAHLLGRKIVIVPKNFASTKICSFCLQKNEININEKTFKCRFCLQIIERDFNAAKNILRKGNELYGTNN